MTGRLLAAILVPFLAWLLWAAGRHSVPLSYNWRSLWQRRTSTLATAGAIAVVVAIFVVVLSPVPGHLPGLRGQRPGRPDSGAASQFPGRTEQHPGPGPGARPQGPAPGRPGRGRGAGLGRMLRGGDARPGRRRGRRQRGGAGPGAGRDPHARPGAAGPGPVVPAWGRRAGGAPAPGRAVPGAGGGPDPAFRRPALAHRRSVRRPGQCFRLGDVDRRGPAHAGPPAGQLLQHAGAPGRPPAGARASSGPWTPTSGSSWRPSPSPPTTPSRPRPASPSRCSAT